MCFWTIVWEASSRRSAAVCLEAFWNHQSLPFSSSRSISTTSIVVFILSRSFSVFCSLNEHLYASPDWSRLSPRGGESPQGRLGENRRLLEKKKKLMMTRTGKKGGEKKSLIDNRRLQLVCSLKASVHRRFMRCVWVLIFGDALCAQWSGSMIQRFWSDTQGRLEPDGILYTQPCLLCMHAHTHAHTQTSDHTSSLMEWSWFCQPARLASHSHAVKAV